MSDNTNKACRKRAADDNKPTSVTMPKSLQEAVIRAADREDRSFSAVVRRAVEQYVAKSA
jgi:predicted transcriptional regulator